MEREKPYLAVIRMGFIDDKTIKEIIRVLNRCYSVVKEAKKPDLVELHVFEKKAHLRLFLEKEKKRIGVGTGFDEAFLTMHEAWTGIPRILVCLERAEETPREVFEGALLHEAAHSILHGSIEYYLLNVSPSFIDFSLKFGLPVHAVRDIAYLSSLALKDNEVTKFLYENGFIEDQMSFIIYFLKPSAEEKATWVIAEKSPVTAILFLVSILKSLACALPLTCEKRYGAMIRREISSSTNFLSKGYRDFIWEILASFEKMQGEFSKDLDTLLGEVSNRLYPLLSKKSSF